MGFWVITLQVWQVVGRGKGRERAAGCGDAEMGEGGGFDTCVFWKRRGGVLFLS